MHVTTRRWARTIGGTLVAALAITLPTIASAPVTAAGLTSMQVVAGAEGLSPSYGTSVTLPVVDARGLAIDPASGRIFAAGDDEVVALTSAGAVLAELPGLAGADEVAAGGGAIWVLARDAPAIARIDPTTLAVTTWSLASYESVRSLVWLDGAVWSASYTFTGTEYRADLLELDPVGGTVTPHQIDSSLGAPQALASTGTDTLYGASGGSPSSVRRWDLSSGAPVLVATNSSLELGRLTSLAVSPDGQTVIPGATVTGNRMPALRASDLQPTGARYVVDGHVAGATYAANGTFAVLSELISQTDPTDLYTFAPGSASPNLVARIVRDYRFAESVRSLAWAPNGKNVALLSHQVVDTGETLHARLHLVPVGTRITGVTPGLIGTHGGATVTVTGVGLAGATTATVNGVTVPVATHTPTTVTFKAPATAAKVGTISLLVDGSTVTSTGSVKVAALGPFGSATTFIDRQYRDILGRAPTPAETASWIARLTGMNKVGTLPAGLVSTPSLVTYDAPIVRLYFAAGLGSPSPSTLALWSGKLRAGSKLSDIAQYFAAVASSNLTDRNFVIKTRTTIDRGWPPTAATVDAGVAQLRRGMTRGGYLISQSETSANITLQASRVRMVELWHKQLHRAPRSDEIVRSVTIAYGGATLASECERVLASKEYAARYPNS